MVCDSFFSLAGFWHFNVRRQAVFFFCIHSHIGPGSHFPILANIITIYFLFFQGTKKNAFIRPYFPCSSRKKTSFLTDHKVRFDLLSAKSAKQDKWAAVTFRFLRFLVLLCGSAGPLVNSFPLKWDFCFLLFQIYFWSACSVGWSIFFFLQKMFCFYSLLISLCDFELSRKNVSWRTFNS